MNAGIIADLKDFTNVEFYSISLTIKIRELNRVQVCYNSSNTVGSTTLPHFETRTCSEFVVSTSKQLTAFCTAQMAFYHDISFYF